MEQQLKERLIGAVVLVVLAVIFIPMILDNSTRVDTDIIKTNIPASPDGDFNSSIFPVQEPRVGFIDVKKPAVDNRVTTKQTPVSDPESIAPKNVQPAIQAADTTLTPKIDNVGLTAWVVQLGSFSSETNANALTEKLREAGYAAFVEPLHQGSGIKYRVRVGPELLRSDAQILRDKLKESMEIEGLVIHYP